MNESTETIEPDTTEFDRLEQEDQRLKSELHMRNAIYDIEAALMASGARSPKLLAEAARSRIQLDEQGTALNREAILAELKREYPEQFAPPEMLRTLVSIDAGAGRSAEPPITKEALSRMTPAEINRLDWAAVRDVLAS